MRQTSLTRPFARTAGATARGGRADGRARIKKHTQARVKRARRAAAALALLLMLLPAAAAEKGAAHTAAEFAGIKEISAAAGLAGEESLAAAAGLASEESLAAAADGEGGATVFLTFDDGPTDSTTPRVLDILRQKRVHATFFVIGRQIRGREDILRRTAAEGHAVGIHSHTHVYREIYASPAALLADIGRCRAAIRAVLPHFAGRLYRFPGGAYGLDGALVAAVKEAGYLPCGWNASAGDAEPPPKSADELLQNALATAAGKERAVLLLHDGVHYEQTVRCLPALIDEFHARGYRFGVLKEP